MKLGDYLKSKGITQLTFAQTVGRSTASVSRWCSGEQLPDLTAARDIERATDGQVRAQDFMPDPQEAA